MCIYHYFSLFLSVSIIHNFPISSMYSTSLTEIVLIAKRIIDKFTRKKIFVAHLTCIYLVETVSFVDIAVEFTLLLFFLGVCVYASVRVLFSLIVFDDERKNRIHRWNEFLVKLFFQLLPHIYRLQTHIRTYPLSHILWQLEILPYSIRSVVREMVNIHKLTAFHAFNFRMNNINPKKDSTSVK